MKEKKKSAFFRKSKGDLLFDLFNYTVLGVITVLVLYPLYFIVIASFSDPDAINTGQVVLFPKGFNTLGYQRIFENIKIWRAYGNTVFYTIVGTCINIIMTMIFAYPLSRKDFSGRKALTFFMMFTMYFQGGLTWYHAKLGILKSLQKLKERKLVNLDALC